MEQTAVLFEDNAGSFLRGYNPLEIFIVGKVEIDDISSIHTNRRCYARRASEHDIGQVSDVSVLTQSVVADEGD